MKKRIFALLMVAVLLLGALAACGKKGPITQDKAKEIAFEQAGLNQKDVTDAHVHIVTENGIPCYSIHISSVKGDFSYVIAASDGAVISGGEGSGH